MTAITNNRDTKTTNANGDKAIRVVVTEGAEGQQIILVDTTDQENFIYVGCAPTGSSPSDPVWRIQRLDLTSSVYEYLYANSDSGFVHVWNDRVGFTYG